MEARMLKYLEEFVCDLKDCSVPPLNELETMMCIALMRGQIGGFNGRQQIHPQHKVGPYRVDFLISFDDKTMPNFIIEVDGHNFHEKTREQVERDKKRDRYFEKIGYKVLRFSGREVYRNPSECVREFDDAVLEEHDRICSRQEYK